MAAEKRKSIGHSTTLPYDMDEEQNLLVVLRQLAESVSARMNEKRVVSRTVQLTIRYYDFQTITRSQTGMDPLWDAISDARHPPPLLQSLASAS
ncbi:hypothetical protein [Geobacillus stearothermophilus]|uniref:DinB/UmuC family translesion DNA polymerase n=1 Tax=Geobacillus stearothermophilus TaxID=1422 RepID=UPI003D24D3B4